MGCMNSLKLEYQNTYIMELQKQLAQFKDIDKTLILENSEKKHR
jgi:hypothetical protein